MFKELASLYSSCKFANSAGALNFIVSWPYLSVFFFSLDVIENVEYYEYFREI